MSKVMLEAAQDLIEDKKYREARAILRDIDDPLAVKWLGQIDDLLRAEALQQTSIRRQQRFWIIRRRSTQAVQASWQPTTKAAPSQLTKFVFWLMIIVMIVAILGVFMITYSSSTLCGDGSHSFSTGSGTCSYHSGEAGNARSRSKK